MIKTTPPCYLWNNIKPMQQVGHGPPAPILHAVQIRTTAPLQACRENSFCTAKAQESIKESVPYQLVQCVAVGHPANESAVGAERDDSVTCDRQVALGCAALRTEHGVDQTKELHHALVLTQILQQATTYNSDSSTCHMCQRYSLVDGVTQQTELGRQLCCL